MSPDEELALLIANRLVEEGFLDASRRNEVSIKIAAGKTTPEDWRLWIELNSVAEEEECGNAQN